eukprot:901711-Karenia_brevis.AAC.1
MEIDKIPTETEEPRGTTGWGDAFEPKSTKIDQNSILAQAAKSFPGADIHALAKAGHDASRRRSSKHVFAHPKCFARIVGHAFLGYKGWNERLYQEFRAISEAFMYDDVARCQASEVAEDCDASLSAGARRELVSESFRTTAHNRGDDRLDRTSSVLLAHIAGNNEETVGKNSIFSTLACVAAAN